MTTQQINKLIEAAITIIAKDGTEKGIDHIAEHCNDEWTITTAEHTRIKVMLFQRKRTSIIIDLMSGAIYKTTSRNDFTDTMNEIDKNQTAQRKTQETEKFNYGITDNDYIGNSELTAGEFRVNLRKSCGGRTLEAELERITDLMHIFEESNMENQRKIQEMQSKGQPITVDFQTEVNRILQLWDLYKEYRDELKHKIFISSEEKALTESSNGSIIKTVKERTTNQSTGEMTMGSDKKPIRFLMHSVTNGVDKVKVRYSASHDDDMNLSYIIVYASSYAGELSKIFPSVINNSDIMTDYFEKDRVKIFPDSPYWTACKAAHDKFHDSMKKRKEKRMNR